MPKITYLKSVAKPKAMAEELLAVIRYHQSKKNLNQGDVAKKISMSPQTFSNRVKNPGNTTLDELLRIIDALHFSNEDILKIFGRKEKHYDKEDPDPYFAPIEPLSPAGRGRRD